MRYFAFLLFPALLLVGCDTSGPDETAETSESTVVPTAKSRAGGQSKVDVCHYDADTDSYKKITIAEPAVDAHLNHGDALPGEEVPTMSGYFFNDSCEPVSPFYTVRSGNVAGDFRGVNLTHRMSCNAGDEALAGSWHGRSGVYIRESRQWPGDEEMWQFRARVQNGYSGPDFMQFRLLCVRSFYADHFYVSRTSNAQKNVANTNSSGSPTCNTGHVAVAPGFFFNKPWWISKARPSSSGEGYDFFGRAETTEDYQIAGPGAYNYYVTCYVPNAHTVYRERQGGVNWAGRNVSQNLSCSAGDLAVSGDWFLRAGSSTNRNAYMNISTIKPGESETWRFMGRIPDLAPLRSGQSNTFGITCLSPGLNS